MQPDTDKVLNYLRNLQDNICKQVEDLDGAAKFQEDNWERPEGGGGRTRILQNGGVFETSRRRVLACIW